MAGEMKIGIVGAAGRMGRMPVRQVGETGVTIADDAADAAAIRELEGAGQSVPFIQRVLLRMEDDG